MPRLALGLLAGVVYGLLSAASILPLDFPDRRAALLGALRLPPWASGLAVGVLLSAADAVITKAYAPVLVLGALGGAAIGWLVGRFGR